MAVEIVTHRQDGGAEVIHTEAGHGGIVLGIRVEFARNRDGSVDKNYLTMPCPVCGAVSTHPVGGGCQPVEVQMEFARLWQMRAQELGIPVEQRGWPQIVALVCEAVEAMDGPGRCRIADTTGPDDIPGAGHERPSGG
jgi:hypothetical protein